MKFILLALLLVGCGATDTQAEFDKWYEDVINEPYDPVNGSKY